MGWIIGIAVAVFVFTVVLVIISRSDSRDSAQHEKDGASVTERRGVQGEKTINHSLNRLIQKDEYLLTNVLLPLRNGNTTEIDSILITRKGVFSIEIKNWVGHISGDDQSEFWIQEYDNPDMDDRKHRNPVEQNRRHCAVLERILNNEINVQNIVIFPEIEDRTNLNSSYTFELDEFIEFYGNLPDNVIREEEIKEIAEKLMPYEAALEEMEEHKEQVRDTYRND